MSSAFHGVRDECSSRSPTPSNSSEHESRRFLSDVRPTLAVIARQRRNTVADVIRAEGLVKTYGDLRALDGLDLAVPEGTVLGLLGPNGAGKTTAVRILTTLLEPDEGTATVAGLDVQRHPAQVRAKIGLSG